MSDHNEVIYIIDDELEMLDILEESFTQLGYSVFTFSDEHKFFEALENYFPSIVVTDLNINGFSGVDLIKKLRAKCPSIPVFVISGCLSKLNREELLNLETLQITEKPFYVSEFTNTIDGIVTDYWKKEFDRIT